LITATPILLLCLACRAPLQIVDIKVNDSCEKLCLSWTTNYDAKCKVTFCDDTQCYVTDLEPEWGTLHNTIIPKGVHNIRYMPTGKISNHLY
jgi:hypothetical protein